MANQGIFIVLEGSDGSGKTTQFERLQARLKKAGYPVAIFNFPRYEHSSSYFVKRYLNGHYGPASKINPYTASLFYALDRFEAAPEIRKALAEGKIVLADRFVGSNMAHQGAKFATAVEKRSFFVWEDSMEYQLLDIPRPDINLFLRVPADTSFKLISDRAKRDYTDKTHDEHEADINYLKNSVETYDLLCQLFPRDFKAIECAPESKLLPIDAISNLIWEELSPLLPKIETSQPKPPKQIAKPPQAGSNPATFEWRIDAISLIALVELSLAGFDVKTDVAWRGGKTKYDYYLPPELDGNLKKTFVESIERIAQIHRKAAAKLPADKLPLLDQAVPLAAAASASIEINKLSILDHLEKFEQNQRPEVVKLRNQLKDKVRQVWPDVWREHQSRVAELTPPEAIGAIIEKLSADMLPQKLTDESDTARLVEASPRNEFDLLADSLYPYSNLSRPEITQQIETWNYQQKYDALRTALLKPTAEGLKLVRYRFDMLTDWLTLYSAIPKATDVQVQPVTPRYGYEVPASIESAGIENEFLDMFDASLSLYSQIQAGSDAGLEEYAALAGHKVRWQASFTAFALCQLANKSLATGLISKVREIHGIVGERLSKPAEKPAPAVLKKRPNSSKRSRGGKPKKY